MGLEFQSYENKRFLAEHYAQIQRKIQRYSVRYLAFVMLGTVVAGLFGLKFMGLFLAGALVTYGFAIFSSHIYHKTLQFFADKKAQTQVAVRAADKSEAEEPLLEHHSREDMQSLAAQDLSAAITHKKNRVQYYEENANFQESLPIPYLDSKHKRALTQLYMLECTKTAALEGDEQFIKTMALDKLDRRHKKAQIIQTILGMIQNKGLSLTLTLEGVKIVRPTWTISGESKQALLKLLDTWNREYSEKPFLAIPEQDKLAAHELEEILTQSLLPLLLDSVQVTQQIKPVVDKKAVNYTREYQISEDYVQNRLNGLNTVKEGAWYSRSRFAR